MQTSLARLFWPITILLLACLSATQALSVRQESQTWDEHLELASGYTYLKTGDYWIIPEHPPLSRTLQALPLLFLGASLPVGHPSWAMKDADAFSHQFLYGNSVPADTMLFATRLVSVALTLCLALAVALWTRGRFGAGAALLALLLFTFDPTVIAHGRYVKNDIAVTLFSFLACAAWGGFLRDRRRPLLFWAALWFGLALASKFSAAFLLPVFLLLYAIDWRRRGEGFGWARLARSMAVIFTVACAVVLLVYAPYVGMLRPVGRAERLANPSLKMLRNVNSTTRTGKALVWIGSRLGLQAHPFIGGLAEFATHSERGHQAYLLGSTSEDGWWFYFPVAFGVKTPVATLLALALFLCLALRSVRGIGRASFDWYILLIPAALYTGASMANKVNIGIRHLLPIYPFLFIAIAAGLGRMEWKYKRPVIAALCALLVVESATIYPHYLAFFNAAVGGPRSGPKYLLDSNIDWGQDARNLKAYMVRNRLAYVCGSYFGRADLSYYDIGDHGLPATGESEQWDKLDCVASVSVTPLYGLYVPRSRFERLRSRKPTATIGYSIYIYDLRKGTARSSLSPDP